MDKKEKAFTHIASVISVFSIS